MLKTTVMWIAMAVPLGASAAETIIQPGLYESVTTMTGSAPETSRHCVTPAEAAKGVDMPGPGEDCKSVRHTFAGGKIDVAQACKDSTWTATGSYTATSFVVDGKVQGKTGGQALNVAIHTVAKRVAATCKPDDE